jgi:hypothetical protein
MKEHFGMDITQMKLKSLNSNLFHGSTREETK